MGYESVVQRRSILYALIGFILGMGAPVTWALIRLIFFPDPGISFFSQVLSDITKTSQHTFLYTYMGVGTSFIMTFLGFFIGRAGDELHLRARELDGLHTEVASQKEMFEHRYKVLDNNIKNFHQISSRIQNSTDHLQVLRLCAEGLHDVLEYERVNILLADEERKNLRFVAATGSAGFSVEGVTIPLDDRGGVIYKAFAERRLFFIDDIGKFDASYHLKSPFNNIKPLRSRSFVLCPIVVKGESIGVFGIDNKFTTRQLNDTDVDTVKLFADQAATAINRINLLKAISALTGELETTFSGFLGSRTVYAENLDNLKTAVASSVQDTANIAVASNSVMESVDDTRSTVSEISVSIEQVTRNLDYLSESIEKSVSAMAQINASIGNVEQNAAVSHEVSLQVKKQADMAQEAVQETISALEDIQRSVELAYAGVTRLSDNSSRIDSIVSVISEITKRTNLLALNASIIAAQAGEYGRSFGVVADEIRNLSLQTGMSTNEITGIMEEIKGESLQTANNIGSTKLLVQKGVEIGQQMGESLKVILESSNRSLDMTREIKTATEEEAKSASLVMQSIEDVNTMASQILNASREQSIGTRNIVKSVDGIMDTAQEMARATQRQVREAEEIKTAVEIVDEMAQGIFDDMEKRRGESLEVVHEMESLKGVAS
ncbi:MAG: GAF domain-containing protein [Geobacter sp.]|nr:GAF domain-containing protein [Geobacter sp.]